MLVAPSLAAGGGGALVRLRHVVPDDHAWVLLRRAGDDPPEALGEEIWRDTSGRLDALVWSIDDTAALVAAGSLLKSRLTALRVYAGGPPGTDGVASPASWPMLDGIVAVSHSEAEAMASRLAGDECIVADPAAGAVVCAACQLAEQLGLGRVVVAIARNIEPIGG